MAYRRGRRRRMFRGRKRRRFGNRKKRFYTVSRGGIRL